MEGRNERHPAVDVERSRPKQRAQTLVRRRPWNYVRGSIAHRLGRLAALVLRFQTILTTTGSVAGTVLVNSALGFVYWWVAVRMFSAESVGLAVAALSAMALLGRLAVMGLGTSLVGILPHYGGNRVGLILAALLVAGTIAVGFGATFAILAPRLTPSFGPLGAGLFAVGLFAAGVALTTIGSVLDAVLIGLLHGSLQFLRNALFATVKLVLLVFAVGWFGDSEATIYATWAAGELVSLLAIGVLLRSRGHVVSVPSPEWQSIFGLGRNALGHHVLNIARVSPALITPVLVAALLSPETNAEFYVALLLASSLQIVASASTFTLYAVATHSPEQLHHQLRFTLGLSVGGVTLGALFLWLTADLLLSFFGWSGSSTGRLLLLLLGLAAYPLIVKDHWIALRRLRQDVRWAAWVTTAGAVLEITFAAVGAVAGGLPGLAAGWLAAQLAQAVLMGRYLYHAAALSTAAARGGDAEV